MSGAYRSLSASSKTLLNGPSALQNRCATIRIESFYPVIKLEKGNRMSAIKKKSSSSGISSSDPSESGLHSSRDLSASDTPSGKKISVRKITSSGLRNRMKKAESFNLNSPGKSIPSDNQFIFHNISCWLFDNVSARASSLLTIGKKNFSPCILAFEVTPIYEEMRDNIHSLLQSTISVINSESPVFFLVGTFKHVSQHNNAFF